MPVIRYLLLCFASLWLLPAQAQPVEGLYRVHEPLASQQPEAREEGLKRAFDTLVLRLTGKSDLTAKSPALANVRANPQQWVTRYGYENGGLLVDFDPATVQAALRQAGVGIWGADRPALLFWWLSESAQGSQLLGDGQENAPALRSAAQYRGLPMRLPLGDLGEQLAITPAVLQSAEAVAALRTASSRYDAEGILAVYVRDNNGSLQADWQLWLGERQTKGQLTGNNLPALADAVMLAAHGFMAPLFIGKQAAAPVVVNETFLLEVQGVTLSRFAELDRQLSPMGRLALVEGDRLLYRLETTREQLKAQLAQLRLQELSAAESSTAPLVTGNTPSLRYRW